MPNVTCQGCQKRLSIPEQYAGQTGRCNHCGVAIVVPDGPPPIESPLAKVVVLRRVYLVSYVLMIAGSVGNLAGTAMTSLLVSVVSLLVGIAALTMFLGSFWRAMASTGYSAAARLAAVLASFIPLIGILALGYIDGKIWSQCRVAVPALNKSRVSPFALLGLICSFLVPPIGVGLGLAGLAQIKRADGEYRGGGIAWTAVGIGSLLTTLFLKFVPSL